MEIMPHIRILDYFRLTVRDGEVFV